MTKTMYAIQNVETGNLVYEEFKIRSYHRLSLDNKEGKFPCLFETEKEVQDILNIPNFCGDFKPREMTSETHRVVKVECSYSIVV